jgi:hypothetical protein
MGDCCVIAQGEQEPQIQLDITHFRYLGVVVRYDYARGLSDSLSNVIEDYAPLNAEITASLAPPHNKLANNLSEFGSRLYDYVENLLGLKEIGEYCPKFDFCSSNEGICALCQPIEETGKKIAVESAVAVFKGLGDILQGNRVCSL